MAAIDELVISSPADFHSHLRQGELMRLVTPHVAHGGFDLAYVMPNLSPPITTTEQAVAYRAELQALSPSTQFLMTLFLSPALSPEEVVKAKAAGISGVKSYPRGVTTGSEGGVESYERYYPVFEEMQKQDMVLNLHGEVPSNPKEGTSVLNAEPRFLQHLAKIHKAFPKLRIVLEHATTKEAVETVKSLGPTVACSITAHHLFLTIDDVVGAPLHFCKPVAKAYEDRSALREIVASGHERFFLGSDSAPHVFAKKIPSAPPSEASPSCACAAGVYTSPHLLTTVAHGFEALEPIIPLDRLEGFVSAHGRRFYKVPAKQGQTVKLRRGTGKVPHTYALEQDVVVPFKAGQDLGWEIVKS